MQWLASSAFFTCNNTSDRKSNGVCKTLALNGVAFSVNNYADVFPSHTLLPWNLSANFTRALMSRPALRYMNNCLFWLAYDHRFEESINHLMRNQKAHHSTQWGDLYSSVPISKIDSSEGESTIPQTPRRRLPLRAWHRAVSPSLHSHPISLGDPRSWDDIRNRHD